MKIKLEILPIPMNNNAINNIDATILFISNESMIFIF